MGYPVRYRDTGPQTVSPSVPRPRPGSGSVVRFPRPYRSPRLPFGPPTALPARASFGMRPRFVPPRLPVTPPSGVGRAAGVGAALGAILWWALNEDFNWATQAQPYIPGWEHVCGPFPWPGPPYLHQTHWTWIPTAITGCIAPLGGQALVVDVAPAPGDDTLLWSFGPNQNGRYYVYDHYVRPDGGPDPALRPHYVPVPAIRGPGVGLAANPADFVAHPIAPPIWASPWFPPEPPYPQGPSRGYVAGPLNYTRGSYDAVTNSEGLSLVVNAPQQRPRDRRPEPREKERKLELGSRAGRLMITSFKALQTWGQINGAVDALWRAIPKRFRSERASWWKKYEEVFTHFDKIDLGQAAVNAAVYAAQIRAFGAAYAAQNRAMRRMFGERGGWQMDRSLNNAMRQREEFGPPRLQFRNKRYYNKLRRWDRPYSGRATPRYRYRSWLYRKMRRL